MGQRIRQMFDKLRKNKKYKFLKPVRNKGQSILEEERFSYPEDRKQEINPALVNYVRKPLSRRSLMSVFLSLIASIFTICAYRLVVDLKGAPDLSLSALAISSILFAVAGFWYGILSFLEKETRMILAYIGLALGGCNFLLWFLVIAVGGILGRG